MPVIITKSPSGKYFTIKYNDRFVSQHATRQEAKETAQKLNLILVKMGKE